MQPAGQKINGLLHPVQWLRNRGTSAATEGGAAAADGASASLAPAAGGDRNAVLQPDRRMQRIRDVTQAAAAVASTARPTAAAPATHTPSSPAASSLEGLIHRAREARTHGQLSEVLDKSRTLAQPGTADAGRVAHALLDALPQVPDVGERLSMADALVSHAPVMQKGDETSFAKQMSSELTRIGHDLDPARIADKYLPHYPQLGKQHAGAFGKALMRELQHGDATQVRASGHPAHGLVRLPPVVVHAGVEQIRRFPARTPVAQALGALRKASQSGDVGSDVKRMLHQAEFDHVTEMARSPESETEFSKAADALARFPDDDRIKACASLAGGLINFSNEDAYRASSKALQVFQTIPAERRKEIEPAVLDLIRQLPALHQSLTQAGKPTQATLTVDRLRHAVDLLPPDHDLGALAGVVNLSSKEYRAAASRDLKSANSSVPAHMTRYRQLASLIHPDPGT